MGKQIYLEKVRELFKRSPVLDFKSVERIIGQKKGSYAKLLVSNLLKRGEIKKIGKGVYTKHDEVSLSVYAFAPAYLGLQCALSFHGVWEQETIPVILTIKKVKRGIRKTLGTSILLRNIDKKYLFGFEYLKEGDFYLPYSDLEKTFIDMFLFNQKIDNLTLRKIKNKIDRKKLKSYLIKCSNPIRRRVENSLSR